MCMQIFAGFFKRIAQFLCVVTWYRLVSEWGMASCLGFLPISASSVKTVSELHNFMVMTLHTIGGASAVGRGFVTVSDYTASVALVVVSLRESYDLDHNCRDESRTRKSSGDES